MKKQLLRFTASMWISLIGSTLNLAIAASQSENGTHFCGGVIDYPTQFHWDSKQLSNRHYAQAPAAATLNVGEPRTVRLIYFLPNDQPHGVGVVGRMKDTVLKVQTFYAEQMEAHGYGKATFGVETDAHGGPIVHRVDGQHPLSYYGTSASVLKELEEVFDRDVNIFFIVLGLGADVLRIDGGISGGVGSRSGKNGGFALVPDGFSWVTVAHELGHAFGLVHNFSDGAYIMSYGPGQNQLSPCSAEYLAVHSYFNPDTSTEYKQPPTIELISSDTYPAGAKSIPIQLKVSDSEGLHQMFLFAKTIESFTAAGQTEVKWCRGLGGERNAIVEFEYDGLVPSGGGVNFFASPTHVVWVEVVDTDGNSMQEQFILTEISPNHIAALEGHRAWVYSVSFSPDGAILASGSEDRTVKLWDVETRQNIATLEGHRAWVYSVSFSPDGAILASGSEDRTVKLWDVETRQNIATLKGHGARAHSVSFSPDGAILASGSGDRTVKLWDVEARQNIATLEGHRARIYSVSFSPDGAILASGSEDRTVKLWDVEARQNIATLEGHRARIYSVSFSPDGAILASGSEDRTVKLWDVEARQNIATLEGHRAWVYSVSFSPDGAILASGSGDRIVKLWDVATGVNFASFIRGGGITSVSFSPDGAILASGGDGNNLWDTSELTQPRLEEVAVFDMPDSNLRAAIATRLRVPPNAPIFRGNLKLLTALFATKASIRNLTGLESAPHLTNLDLRDNLVSDLSPLVANTGLGNGDTVDVRGNPLSYLSIHTHIPALQNRGVTVEFNDRAHPALLKISGDRQKGTSFTPLSQPFVVEVQNEQGLAFEGVPVTFTVTTGGGVLGTINTTTDENGRAESTFILGPNLGSNTVLVSADSIEGPITFYAISDNLPTEYLLSVPAGVSLIHIPLEVTTVDGVAKSITSVADLYDTLGGANTVNLLITRDPTKQRWHSYLGESSRGTIADKSLTDDIGIIAFMNHAVSIRLRGGARGTNGNSSITLHPGLNLVGVPVRDLRILRVNDLFTLEGIGHNISTITVLDNGRFKVVSRASIVNQVRTAGDTLIDGGHSFILTARETITVTISGGAWYNTSEMATVLPPPIPGIEVGDATPVLVLKGSIVDEGARVNKEGFSVIVKNLSTDRAIPTVIGNENLFPLDKIALNPNLIGGVGYQITVVDVGAGRLARIGDILEISAQFPDASIRVQPFQHTVTAEDVLRSRIELGEIVTYEVLWDTELLQNYPNPFRLETWIPYRLAEDALVTLTLYDLSGGVVHTFDVGHRIAEVYENQSKAIYWDGRNGVGERVASGIYFYTLTVGDYSATRKMVIRK